jgi:hypothetical protein
MDSNNFKEIRENSQDSDSSSGRELSIRKEVEGFKEIKSLKLKTKKIKHKQHILITPIWK